MPARPKSVQNTAANLEATYMQDITRRRPHLTYFLTRKIEYFFVVLGRYVFLLDFDPSGRRDISEAQLNARTMMQKF